MDNDRLFVEDLILTSERKLKRDQQMQEDITTVMGVIAAHNDILRGFHDVLNELTSRIEALEGRGDANESAV